MNRETICLRRAALGCMGVTASVAWVSPASAWNGVGHRAVAELVWRPLGVDQCRAASYLLKQPPHCEDLLAVDVPVGGETNEWVFWSAAAWPPRNERRAVGQTR